MAVIDETGKKYGLLTVLRREGTYKYNKRATWLCLCDCGEETIAVGLFLRLGRKKSCGCLRANRLPKGEAAFRKIYGHMQHNAKRRNYEWALSSAQVRQLIQQCCHYCGAKPAQCCKTIDCNGSYIYNGLDRIDNTIGYVLSNVMPCCRRCNRAKDTMGIEEFREWIAKVHERFQEGY